MKINLLFTLVIVSVLSYGQQKIEIESGNESFSVGNVDVLKATIYEADHKYVEKAWKKLLKRYSGSVKVKSEIFADDVLIKKMSDNTVDVYTKIKEKKDNVVEIVCAVDLGGAFLSKSAHPNKFKVFKGILHDFVVDVSKEALQERINDEEKIFSKLDKEQTKLVSDQERMTKEIKDYQQKIKDNEAAIEQNIKDQELKKKDIETQKALIISLSEKEKAIN